MTRGDAFVIAGALVLALLVWGGLYVLPRSSAEMTAVVRVDGKEVARLPVTAPSMSQKNIAIPLGVATVSFGQGKVRVEPLDTHTCPTGICWKTGFITRAGQAIVCVPNHMTITLEGAVDEIDSVVR